MQVQQQGNVPNRVDQPKCLRISKHFFREIFYSVTELGELSHFHCQISSKTVKSLKQKFPLSFEALQFDIQTHSLLSPTLKTDLLFCNFFTIFVLNLEDIWKVSSLKRLLFKLTLFFAYLRFAYWKFFLTFKKNASEVFIKYLHVF